jgi:hypothetical protein
MSDAEQAEPTVDPEVIKAIARLRAEDAATARELDALFQKDAPEAELQQCIEKHEIVWRFVTANKPVVVSKFRLADAFVPDFLVFGSRHWCQSQLPTAHFVELERASQPLFTKAGDPSSFLVHALRQVRDWKHWVTQNRSFVRDRLVAALAASAGKDEAGSSPAAAYAGLPQGFLDRYVVVIGRRASMTPDDRVRLQQMNEETEEIQIVTYDMLLDMVAGETPFIPSWRYYAVRTAAPLSWT